MADIRRIPFTEMYERVKNELVRDATIDSLTENKYMGRVNDVYMYDLPSQIDWRYVRKTGTLTAPADYITGTVAVTNASTTVTGTGTTFTSANSNGFLLKLSGYNEVYRVTYVSATELTLDRAWVEATASGVSYTIYQDRIQLASDYDHMVLNMNKAVYYWKAGNRQFLDYYPPDEFEDMQTNVPGEPNAYTIKWISNDPYLFINPASTIAITLQYDYIPTFARLDEYTTGTITTLANGGTAVTGSGTDFDGYVSDTAVYDYYLRIDSDGTGSKSKWYKIASAGSDTAITLSDAYAGTAISGGTSAYTITKISTLPPGLDMAIIYGAAIISAAEQDDKNQVAYWTALYEKFASQYRQIESKRGFENQRIRSVYEKPGARR